MTVDVRLVKIEEFDGPEDEGIPTLGTYTQIIATPDVVNYDTVYMDGIGDVAALIAELEGRSDVNYV